MEPLVLFCLASNVVQFVDFSFKVIGRITEAYRHGTTLEVQEMTDRVSKLQSISEALQTSLDTPQDITPEEQALLEIAKRCVATAEELQILLINLYKSSNYRVLTFLRKFWRTLRRSDAVTKLADELAKFQDDMNTHVLVSLHSSARHVIQDQKSAFASLGNDLKHLVSQLAGGVDRLSDLNKYESERTQTHVSREHGITPDMLAEGLRKLQASIDSYFTTECKKAFVESLSFPEVKLREQQIAAPHANTCEWIFEQRDGNTCPWSSFTDWLTSSEAIYWICGKPASGKSVTMSYICLDDRTKSSLLQGSPQIRNLPVVIKFFFWNAGSPLQKCAAGFLQSVIVQILDAEPRLYEHLVTHTPQLQTRPLHSAWSTRKLRSTLETILSDLSRSLAVFLDGLDEFDEGEEYLLELIAIFQRYRHVKLCLSSRPSPRLRRLFGNGPMLRIEDLNRESINGFVHARLSNDPSLKSLLINRTVEDAEAQITSLAAAITEKAQGVFLWAKLAVESIREGLETLDSFETLSKRLEMLPPELDDMYEQIWNKIDRSPYAEEARLAFVATLHGEKPLPVLFEDVDHYIKTAGFPVLLSASDIVSQDLQQLEMQLLVWCRGLLEVTTSEWPALLARWKDFELDSGAEVLLIILLEDMKVRFMHRTAYDFALSKLHREFRDRKDRCAQAWKDFSNSPVDGCIYTGHVLTNISIEEDDTPYAVRPAKWDATNRHGCVISSWTGADQASINEYSNRFVALPGTAYTTPGVEAIVANKEPESASYAINVSHLSDDTPNPTTSRHYEDVRGNGEQRPDYIRVDVL